MKKPHVLLMGQTPPPWHGQAVATQILFDYDWPGYEIHRLRMEYSTEMLEVGRLQLRKVKHLFELVFRARKILKEHPDCILFYPPSSAKWVPFLRDVVFLTLVRPAAAGTVFIFHASGLPVFARKNLLSRILAFLAYRNSDVSLEVAQEALPAHEAFGADSWEWCPCGIDVPDLVKTPPQSGTPLEVLFVASLQEGKGVLEILKTAKVLKQQGREQEFRFRIVGRWFSEEFEREARQLRQTLQVEEMVEYVGQLTGDAKWQAYASADVFFFPTHYASEATPIVIMEALGMGLPVVSTQWAGIPAMLDGCETSKLLPVRDPEAFASALLDMAGQRDRWQQIDHQSRKFYESRFKPIRFIERVERAFRLVAQKHGIQQLNDKHEVATEQAASNTETPDLGLKNKVRITAYLADQNPGYDRSFGISRMSHMVLNGLQQTGGVEVEAVVSQTSQQAPESVRRVRMFPWGTRNKWVRMLTDHLHPLLIRPEPGRVYYYPKGYLPWLQWRLKPSVVTIHDTIIQYDADHYPCWRRDLEYWYWSWMLRHTLRHADRIMTVSESSRRQINKFMQRHGLPAKEIAVTYEPCLYEDEPQPVAPEKGTYVIHLASAEPHKRTAHLMRAWSEMGLQFPTLHLIGHVPKEVEPLLACAKGMVKRPFLNEEALKAAYMGARALIFPSEIEGFGLPALEAYYLGTPVCYVRGTSVEEVLSVATTKGGFDLERPESLLEALEEVMSMTPQEIRTCALKLRETYTSKAVIEKMIRVMVERA